MAQATSSVTSPIASDQEILRDRLVNSSKTNPNLSLEIQELIQRIGNETPSIPINRIITHLRNGYYTKMTLPLFFLVEHLKQAGLTQLADEIRQKNFKDPLLNPPRGCREEDFRIHDPLGHACFNK